MSKDFEEDETRIRMHADLERQFAELLDEADERGELIKTLAVPDEIEPVVFAAMLRGLYTEVVKRAGLEHADPHEVALVATPESLLLLATGGDLGPDNPLAKLRGPRQ